jgi:hypothetical protein
MNRASLLTALTNQGLVRETIEGGRYWKRHWGPGPRFQRRWYHWIPGLRKVLVIPKRTPTVFLLPTGKQGLANVLAEVSALAGTPVPLEGSL